MEGGHLLRFLDKNDREKIEILKYLDARGKESQCFKKITEDTGYSSYQIQKIVSELNDDLQKLKLRDDFKLEVNRGAVKYCRNEQKNIAYLMAQFANQSRVKALISAILQNDVEDIFDLEEILYLSTTQTYQFVREFEKKASFFDIKIDKNIEFVGIEWEIRNFLYQYYYNLFGVYVQPFPLEIVGIANEIKEDLYESDYFKRSNLTDGDELKLLYFLIVMLSRNLSGNVAQQFDDGLDHALGQNHELFVIFSQYLKGNEIGIREEVLQFVYFLHTESIVKFDNFQTHHKILALNALVVEQVSIVFDECLFRNKSAFIEDLTNIHRLAFFYKRTRFSTALYENFSFHAEYYKISMTAVEKIIQRLLENSDLKNFVKRFKNNIIHEYVFLLLGHLKLDQLIRPINISICFSYGTNYDEYLTKAVLALGFLNLNVVKSDADIYLSDVPSQKNYSAQVIWSGAPTLKDWQDLDHTIIKVRQEKSSLKEEI